MAQENEEGKDSLMLAEEAFKTHSYDGFSLRKLTGNMEPEKGDFSNYVLE